MGKLLSKQEAGIDGMRTINRKEMNLVDNAN